VTVAAPRVPAADRSASPLTSGLLVVDKPAGPTSHDVVELVRRRLRAPGAGHVGTLDPAATGLLLVAVGAATRCVPVWQRGLKTYEAAIRFGLETSTQDLGGEVIARGGSIPDEAAIRAASREFVGDLEQLPPMVSAVKVGGRRLHELAREGRTAERRARRVRVEDWSWLEFSAATARCRIRCSGGTYVRTLAHDLGRKLGCGAAIAALRRLASEPFDLSRAVTIDELRSLDTQAIWERAGIPLTESLAHLPSLSLTAEEATRVGHGNPVLRPGIAIAEPGERLSLLLCDASGMPLALAAARSDPHDSRLGWVQPDLVFPWAVREGPPKAGRA